MMRKTYLDYILEETYISLKKGGFLNVISISTITITLFIFGVFLLVTQNLPLVLHQWKADIHLIVFFQNGKPETECIEFMENLKSNAGILRVEYISQDDAHKFMQKKGYGFLLENLEENPLPSSAEVSLNLDKLTSSGIEDLISRIKKEEIVESVSYGGGFFETLASAIWISKTLGIFLVSIYAIASIFIIATTIRLTVFTRQEEISIMRLVGATSWFIRWPYLFGGIIQGLIGSLLSIIFLFVLFRLITAKLDFESLAVFGIKGIVFFTPMTILLMVLGGITVGCFGSILSLRKVIRT